jgi:hypothetical protein
MAGFWPAPSSRLFLRKPKDSAAFLQEWVRPAEAIVEQPLRMLVPLATPKPRCGE